MTPDPITIEPDATVHEAARLIARKKHNRLPVVEHGRLVGVVTRVDVLDGADSPRMCDAAGAGPGRPRRDRAQLRAAGRAWPRRRGCARSSRPTATATARCRPRARRWPAARRGWRWPRPARRPSCARPGIDGAAARDGRAVADRSSTSRSRRAPTSSPGARTFVAALAAPAPRRARQARHRHGPARHARPRRGARASPRGRGGAGCGSPALMTHFATADEDDPAFVARAARRASPWASGCARASRRARARRQLRRGAARAGRPLRHGPLRHRDLRAWTRSARDPAAHGLEPALELRPTSPRSSRCAPGQSAGYGRRFVAERDDLARHAPDRLRRRRPPRADQQRRRARRRPPRAARRHRHDGQHHGRPRRRRRPRAGAEAVLIGARGGERILAEELARAAGHDQLRDHLRASRARVPRGAPLSDRAAGPPRARRWPASEAWLVGGAVRDRLLGRPTDDLDLAWPATPRPAARALAPRRGGAAFPLSDAFGAWRVVGPGHAWQVDLVPLRDGDIARRPRRARLHRQRDRRAARRRRAARPARRPRRPRGAAAADGLRRRARRRPAAHAARGPARGRARASTLDPATGAARRAPRAGASTGVAPERVFAELKRVVARDRAPHGPRADGRARR